MGHRVYLSNIKDNTSFSVFESNNNLPLFWLLLLDEETVSKDRDYMIELFDDEESEEDYDYNSCIHISSDILQANIDRSLDYLKKINSNLEDKFKDFSKFILAASKDNTIEFDIMQLANFTSAEDFLNTLCAELRQIDNGEIIREVAYYTEHSPDYYELVGYECLEDEEYHFKDYSEEYKSFVEKNAKGKLAYAKENNVKSEKKQIVSTILFPIIVGIVFIIAGILMLINNEGIFIGIVEMIFGVLAVFFGYANIRFKK